MRFEWDAGKSDRNLVERGFDFGFAAGIFESPTLERVDDRRDYGERRVVALGVVDGAPIVVVCTDRSTASGVVRRIVSARLANRQERATYGLAISKE